MIKSADNYIEVFFKKAGEIKRQLIRNSLRKIETLLADYEFIFKCHRSFIVNVNHIKEVQGSSQGFQIFFEGIEAPALVSQKYIDDFKKLI
jgi:DNA-binding LytR/AlgR family response regulator